MKDQDLIKDIKPVSPTMKWAKKYIFNKYFITIFAFLVWMVFFDSTSFLVINEMNGEIKKYEKQLAYYKSEYEKNDQFYKKLIALRKSATLISQGSYKAAYQDSEHIYAFIREDEGRRLLVVNNFSNQVVDFSLMPDFKYGQILVNNYDDYTGNSLQPYQSIAFLSE